MKKAWIVALVGLAVALVVGGILSPLASSRPDGLERVAQDKGFASKGESTAPVSPMPDYAVPGVRDESASKRMAGAIGTAAAFGMGTALAFAIIAVRRRRKSRQSG